MFGWLRKLWNGLFGRQTRIDDIPEATEPQPPARSTPPPKPPSVYAAVIERLRGSMTETVSRMRSGEITAIRSAVTELEHASVFTIEGARVATVYLERLWAGDKAFVAAARQRAATKGKPAEGWSIGLCTEFLRQLEGAEQSFKGRILQAIRKLANSPGQAAGRLTEPLGPATGPWVYPIGQARMLYVVDDATKMVFLLSYC